MSNLPEARQRPHPTALTYVAVAAVLTVVTIIEVAIYYLPVLKPYMVPILLLLSATKFSLVVLFYMHLKFDHRLFAALFVGGMWLAIGVIVALLALFGAFVR
jgi:cytochrome c oxidase subunit 4